MAASKLFAAFAAGVLCSFVPTKSRFLHKLTDENSNTTKGAEGLAGATKSDVNDASMGNHAPSTNKDAAEGGDIIPVIEEAKEKAKDEPREEAQEKASIAGDSAPTGEPYCIIQFHELKQGLDEKSLTLIDVRTPEELYCMGRIPGSINVPLSEIPEAFLEEKAQEFYFKYGIQRPCPPGCDLVFSCKTGKRAAKAVDKLRPLGYTNAMLYQESFIGWAKHGGEYCKHGPLEEKAPPPAS